MYDQYMANTIYNVIADYEKYVAVQKQNGNESVSFIKYALGNL